MEIALLGGTGDIGEGLALRWARDTDHSIIIGSRDSDRAERKANEYRSVLKETGATPNVAGYGNETAAEFAEVVVVSVPPEYASSTVESVAPVLGEGDILVSPAVRMTRDAAGFHYDPPEAGTVAEAIDDVAPVDVPVVSAFQNLAAGALSDLDNDLEADVIVTGDDGEAKRTVEALAEDIDGLRALDGGPLANTGVVESLTPLLINLAMNNDGMHDVGVRFE
ncbi:NADPH-dependent F420 reductase (plasmid) [Haloterrigena turkmenica DSM 5511]|uniref:NADPH-dependent F420 reductase n=1 Tax=Haloterrigena turkmenica (strain ATCC 51198 / DSM 5511 / JCM 9101 / NCIMB 13204 / VKM B-1734 / 4k) TaxID=543526 RepID=D2S0A2_HALTV|nr:NADPH-dependent F420 reductase [Haloterrigena turkmenica]ADB62799.1 NADPH-dependent F420 reductase [Haloterrigena turkmenica DSM 5511]